MKKDGYICKYNLNITLNDMAKELIFKLSGADYGAAPVKLERKKIYGWTDIVAIAAGSNHTLGLRADGTVVATEYTGDKKYYQGQCDVSGLRLFSSLETIKTERKAAMDKAEAKRKADEESAKAKRKAKIEALNAEKAQLDAELPSIKGLFAASKRAKIEGRLAEIEAVLKKLGG